MTNEKTFLSKIEKMGFKDLELKVNIYYTLDENGNVILDVAAMEEQFNSRIEELESCLK